jgi:hypothetical protein
LPKEKPASKYWPGNFSNEQLPKIDSDDGPIILEGDGNELSEEFEIIFDNDWNLIILCN